MLPVTSRLCFMAGAFGGSTFLVSPMVGGPPTTMFNGLNNISNIIVSKKQKDISATLKGRLVKVQPHFVSAQ